MELSLIENTFEPIAIVDNDFKIINFNPSFVTFVKLSPRILKKDKKLTDIFTLDENVFKDLAADIKDNNKTMSLSKELDTFLQHNEDHNCSVVFKMAPLDDNLNQVFILDMSVEKNLYQKYRLQMEELKKNHQTLLQADKLRTLGELTANISHEINNPLAIAFGNVEIMQSLLEDNNISKEAFQNYTAKIARSIERIKGIITNMKGYIHRQNEVIKEYCDISDIIDASLEFIRPSAMDKSIKLTLNKKSEKIITLINKIELEQVLVNLSKNAIDALAEAGIKGGEITISAEKTKPHNDIQISIKDNGPGIPSENLEQIFDPFFTTKEVGKGTGLGLAIAKQIVEKNNGTIAVDSSDKGTIFTITLPAIEISSLAYDDNFIQNISDDTKKKVLVVDDEVEVLNVISQYVKDQGHIIIGSTSPKDAIDIIQKIQVDLIITDYNMPDLTGSKFAEIIRESDDQVPIYYLTSKKYIKNFQEDKDVYDINGLILKPFSKDEIIKVLSTAFKKA